MNERMTERMHRTTGKSKVFLNSTANEIKKKREREIDRGGGN